MPEEKPHRITLSLDVVNVGFGPRLSNLHVTERRPDGRVFEGPLSMSMWMYGCLRDALQEILTEAGHQGTVVLRDEPPPIEGPDTSTLTDDERATAHVLMDAIRTLSGVQGPLALTLAPVIDKLVAKLDALCGTVGPEQKPAAEDVHVKKAPRWKSVLVYADGQVLEYRGDLDGMALHLPELHDGGIWWERTFKITYVSELGVAVGVECSFKKVPSDHDVHDPTPSELAGEAQRAAEEEAYRRHKAKQEAELTEEDIEKIANPFARDFVRTAVKAEREDRLVNKARLCVAIARRMLPNASEVDIEAQALSLMGLPDDEVRATYERAEKP